MLRIGSTSGATIKKMVNLFGLRIYREGELKGVRTNCNAINIIKETSNVISKDKRARG